MTIPIPANTTLVPGSVTTDHGAVDLNATDVVVTVRGSANPKLNGDYFRGKASSLTGLTIRGSGDNEHFVIDPALGVPVTVAGGAGSSSLETGGQAVTWNVTGVNTGNVASRRSRIA